MLVIKTRRTKRLAIPLDSAVKDLLECRTFLGSHAAAMRSAGKMLRLDGASSVPLIRFLLILLQTLLVRAQRPISDAPGLLECLTFLIPHAAMTTMSALRSAI